MDVVDENIFADTQESSLTALNPSEQKLYEHLTRLFPNNSDTILTALKQALHGAQHWTLEEFFSKLDDRITVGTIITRYKLAQEIMDKRPQHQGGMAQLMEQHIYDPKSIHIITNIPRLGTDSDLATTDETDQVIDFIEQNRGQILDFLHSPTSFEHPDSKRGRPQTFIEHAAMKKLGHASSRNFVSNFTGDLPDLRHTSDLTYMILGDRVVEEILDAALSGVSTIIQRHSYIDIFDHNGRGIRLATATPLKPVEGLLDSTAYIKPRAAKS